MRKIPFVGGDWYTRSGYTSDQIAINLYPEQVPADAKGQSGVVLNPTPGSEVAYTLGSGPIRGMIVHQKYLYVVSGTELYRIKEDGTTINIGDANPSGTNTDLSTSTGLVSMAESGAAGGQVAIGDGEQIYVAYHDSAQATITDIVKETSPTTIQVPGHPFAEGDVIYITGVVDDGPGGDFGDLFNSIKFRVNAVEDADNINVDLDSSNGITNDYASGGLVQRERFFNPGLATNSGDLTFGVFSTEDNDSIGEANATDAIAWSSASNASASDNSDATASTVGQVDATSGAAGTVSDSGSDWSTVSNASGSDNAYATATPADDTYTSYIQVTNFSLSIPSAAQIVGLTFDVECKKSDTAAGDIIEVRPIVGGSITGSTRSRAGTITSTDVTYIINNTTYDLAGLSSLTATQANASTFGFAVRFYNSGPSGGETVSVDNLLITVHYLIPTDYLRATDAGAALASGDQVFGVEVDIEAAEDNAGRIKFQSVQLVVDGSAQGDDKGSDGGALTGADATYTFGGSGQMWGLDTSDLNPTSVNAESFGVQVSFTAADSATASDDVQVDFINIKVYYQTAGAVRAEHILWFDSYFLANNAGTGDVYYTNNGAQLWDNVNDKFNAERDPDNVVVLQKKNRELWLLGDSSGEAWFNSGDDIPFDPIDSAFSDLGLAAQYSVARASDSILYLSQDERGAGRVIRISGFQPSIVSQAIEWQLGRLTKISDAQAYVYYLDGHEFYVLTFPTARKTFVYDLATKVWHSWESPGVGGRHFSSVHVYWPSKKEHYVGHYDAATVHRLTNDLYTEGGTRIVRERVSHHMTSDLVPGAQYSREGGERKKLRYYAFEIDVMRGHIPLQDAGQDPYPARVGLSWSDDGGATFTEPKYRNLGEVGNHERLKWQMLGSSRDRIWKIITDAPYNLQIVDAFAVVEVGSW